MATHRHNDIATRALVVAWRCPSGGKTTAETAILTGISVRQVNYIHKRALKRGFQPDLQPVSIRNEFLEDASRSGRPTKQTNETKEQVIAKK